MVCTFFGHSDTPSWVAEKLKETIISLIDAGVCTFYVGNHGNFDFMVRRILGDLQKEYTHIKYLVVLAYLPVKKGDFDTNDYSKTIYPDGIENTPLKFAISYRNK